MSRVHAPKPFSERTRGYSGVSDDVTGSNQASFRALRQKEGIQIDSRSQAYVAPTHQPIITSKNVPVHTLGVPSSPSSGGGRSRYTASRQSRPTSQQQQQTLYNQNANTINITSNATNNISVRKVQTHYAQPQSSPSTSIAPIMPGSALPPLKTNTQPHIMSTPVTQHNAPPPATQGGSHAKWMPHAQSLFEKCEIQLYDPCLVGCGDLNAYNNSIKGLVYDKSRLFEQYSTTPSRTSSVYYIGNNRPHGYHQQVSDTFPNPESYVTNKQLYKVVPGDHIAFRYEVVKILGKGSYGIVVLVRDHATNTVAALKIMKKKTVEAESSQREKEVLKAMVGPITLPGMSVAAQSNVKPHVNPLFSAQVPATQQAEQHVVNLISSFRFRGFECLVMELLHQNLYSFLKQNHFKIEEKPAVALIHSALQSIFSLHQRKIVHCDVKPENLLLTVATPPNSQVQLTDQQLKIVDFGTSWVRSHYNPQYYIQSRYYRAPEVIQELPYDDKIDVFSIGCMVSELLTGQPLFVSGNEIEHLYRLMEVLGPPSPDILRNSKKRGMLVSNQGLLLNYDPQRLGRQVPDAAPIAPFGSKVLHKTLKYHNVIYDYNRLSSLPIEAFCVKDPRDANITLYPYTKVPVLNNADALQQWLIVDFIWCCLGWDRQRRMNSAQALRHPLMLKAFKWQEGILETNAITDYIEKQLKPTHGQPSPGKPNTYAQTQQTQNNMQHTQPMRNTTYPHQRRVF